MRGLGENVDSGLFKDGITKGITTTTSQYIDEKVV